MVLYLMTLTDL